MPLLLSDGEVNLLDVASFCGGTCINEESKDVVYCIVLEGIRCWAGLFVFRYVERTRYAI